MSSPDQFRRSHRRPSKWNLRVCFGLLLWLSLITIALLSTPSMLWDDEYQHVVFVVGGFGLWRFGWWANHVIRAAIYGKVVYPKLKADAERAWARGPRPQRVHFMVTTFRERPEITTAVVRSIIGEVRSTGMAATLWLGSGDQIDEDLFAQLITEEAGDLSLDLVISRQDRPGKRYAIGMSLRAIRRSDIRPDEIVVFMDGDSIIVPGMLQKCLPLFAADPHLGALTTDETVMVEGPKWIAHWLSMRFAQRRVGMQSHSLAGKILTLTGRLSLFRAHYVTDPGFIEMVEEDFLDHWLWGRFRFLSGDDKSTWYYMLREGARTIYVPDACCITIEFIEGSGYDRMVQNLRRWSGNMLRNGARAIALGPRRVGFFTWWCLVDQRIAMWTMLISPVLALGATLMLSSIFVPTYIAWILITRFVQSLVLWIYSPTVLLSFPVYLYANQMLNASVKVYCLFRLAQQRWTNRGDQKAGFGGSILDGMRRIMAGYLTFVAVLGLVLAIVSYAGFVRAPSIYTVTTLLEEVRR
jgi:glycosyltransferase Alg8